MNLLIFNLKTDADDGVLGFTTDWINALARHFGRVLVITMSAGRIAVAPNVEVASVGKEKGYSEPRRAIEFYRLLAGALRRDKYGACFAHMMPLFAVMGWPLLRARGIPIVMWYAHGSVTPILRAAALAADRIVTSGKSGFGIETPKLRIIGQGIDTGRFAPREVHGAAGGRFRILTVGRISRIKRLETQVEAAAILRKRGHAGVRMRFVGNPLTKDDEAYFADLKARALSLGIPDGVEFAGGVPFHLIHEEYGHADAFASMSATGSLDKAVLEAMSTGLPVLASDPQYREMLGAGLADACMVPPADAAALAGRIEALAAMDPAERADLGRKLRERVVEGHSLKRLAAVIAAEIASLAASPKSKV